MAALLGKNYDFAGRSSKIWSLGSRFPKQDSNSTYRSGMHMAHVSKKWFQDAAKHDLKSEKSLADSRKSPIPVKKVFSKSVCHVRTAVEGLKISWKMLEDAVAVNHYASCGVGGVGGVPF